MALQTRWVWLAAVAAACALAVVLAALPVAVRLRMEGGEGADGRSPAPLEWTLVVSVVGLAVLARRGSLPGGGRDAPGGGAGARAGGAPGPGGAPEPAPDAAGGARRSPGRRRGLRGLAADLGPAETVLRALLRLGRGVSIRRLDLQARIGTGDAASTALACGAAWGILGGAVAALGAWARYRCTPRLMVSPLFARRGWALRTDCIMALRLGQITLAALSVVVAAARGRLREPRGGVRWPWSRVISGGRAR